MLHPAQTGVYQEGISCIKEDDVNLWFYTKNDVTIAIDAGHLVFKVIEEEFKKIGIDPLAIKTLLLTHSDVDQGITSLSPRFRLVFCKYYRHS